MSIKAIRSGVAFACLGLAGCTPGGTSGPRTQAAPVCLASYLIDHTDIPDDSTILFTMRDHSVWKNRLDYPCIGLRNDTRGFTYEPTNPATDEICSNLVTIRLNTYGNVCPLGLFVRVNARTAQHS